MSRAAFSSARATCPHALQTNSDRLLYVQHVDRASRKEKRSRDPSPRLKPGGPRQVLLTGEGPRRPPRAVILSYPDASGTPQGCGRFGDRRMGEPLDTLGLYYDERSYVEPGMVQGGVPSGGPPGMTGRQVAGKGFLDAYLDAGEAGRLVAILARPSGREPLRKALERTPRRGGGRGGSRWSRSRTSTRPSSRTPPRRWSISPPRPTPGTPGRARPGAPTPSRSPGWRRPRPRSEAWRRCGTW